MQQRPAWRIGRLEMAGPWGWNRLPADKLTEVREKLSQFETMTWREMLMDAKKRYHNVPIANLSSAAQARLEQLGQADIDQILSLRISAKERVWGIQHSAVVNLLWWDPEHQVCPSEKKHT